MTCQQMRLFWGAFSRACEACGISCPSEKEDYRHKVMIEETGCQHLSEVSKTDGFERLMTRLNADAGNYRSAGHFSCGSDRRTAAMLNDCARQLLELSGKQCSVIDYVRALMKQSKLRISDTLTDTWWMDYPDTTPEKVFQMLDSHRRRLVKRRSAETGERLRLTYKFGHVYGALK